MRGVRLGAVLALVATAGVPIAVAHAPAEAGGFETPESAYWDGPTGSFVVSNIGPSGDPTGREPDGYLSRVAAEGRRTKLKWVEGLRSPKGMRRSGGDLYVADVGQIVVVDVAAATIRDTIDLDAIGAMFPNDVAVDEGSGDLYVSDTFRSAIYRLPAGSSSPEVFLESPDLESPNGILVDAGRLLVATTGQGLDPATFTAERPGRVLTVDLATKAIAPYGGMAPFATLDGLEKLGDDLVVTDNPGGRVVLVKPDGATAEVAGTAPGAADIGLRRADRIVAVPQLRDGAVRFIEVPAG
jgi:hypothetical protein